MIHKVRYVVTVRSTTDSHEKFIAWMRQEHAADMLQMSGCQTLAVFAISPGISRCEYLFDSQDVLDDYIENRSSTLREKTKGRFDLDEFVFERTQERLILEM
jgi:hypothetical protein